MKVLKNRPTARELVEYLGIQPVELPGLLKKGLPAYYGDIAKKVRDLSSITKKTNSR